MKTILVPTDFSKCANNALQFAAFIAKKTGAAINLLHVAGAPPREGAFGLDPDVHEMLGSLMGVKKIMSKTLSQPGLKGITVKDMVEVGEVHIHIIAAAKKCEADMIIMGTHGASGLKEFLIGSNAEKVVRNAPIPVLTVKNMVSNPRIEKIAYATDFSEETERVFPSVKKFADLFGAKIEMVKVVTESTFETGYQTKKNIEHFKRHFKDEHVTAWVYNDLTTHKGIRHFAHSASANIIALGTHGRQGLARLFEGSVAEKLVNHSSLPVLILNIPKTEVKKETVKGTTKTKINETLEKPEPKTTLTRLSI